MRISDLKTDQTNSATPAARVHEDHQPINQEEYLALVHLFANGNAIITMAGDHKEGKWNHKIPRGKGWNKRETAASLERVLEWVNHTTDEEPKHVGFVPESAGIAVIDIDHGGEAAVQATEDSYGPPLFRYSTSCKEGENRYHMGYPCGDFELGDGPVTNPKTGEHMGEMRWKGHICIPRNKGALKLLGTNPAEWPNLPAVDLSGLLGNTPTDAKGAAKWGKGTRNTTLNEELFRAVRKGDPPACGPKTRAPRGAGDPYPGIGVDFLRLPKPGECC